MVKVRIKLRLSRVPGKAGTVFYRLSHQKAVKQITTRIHLLPEVWNVGGECLRDDAMQANPRLSAIQRLIDNDVALIWQIIQSYDVQKKKFSLQQVADAFHSSQGSGKVLAYMRHLTDELFAKGKRGTARNYQCTLASFSAFLNEKDIPFSLLNESLILEYADWLEQRGVLRNSSSFYMRNLRSMYNKAVRRQGIRQLQPFQNVYTGIDKTSKRAVSEELIARLLGLELSYSSRLAFARDLFIFSYCTRGMAFVDIAYLRKTDIKNGYICYARRKTNQELLIRVEDFVQRIIDRYADGTRDTSYVFPIIHSTDDKKAYSQYQTGLRYYNKCLKEIATLLGDGITLTSYTPRHSWANIARSHHVSISIISEGMGHASEKTTRIYLASLDNSLIDNANSEIIFSLERWKDKNKGDRKEVQNSTFSK